MKKNQLLLGAHISVAQGLEKAFERGESIGCTAMQIFTKSNRQWKAKEITPEQADLFCATAKKSSIVSTMVHASYLINIASSDESTHLKSTSALIEELERCDKLKIPFLVLHPGTKGELDEKKGLDYVVENLEKAFAATSTHTMVLLEIMAGQGSSVCYSFDQLAYILKKNKYKSRLGICFDTCHAFAAGYDFRTQDTYKAMWKEFNETIGLEHLKAIHLNDSKKDLGSRVDRHEEIGKGKLGLEAFRFIMNDEKLFNVPKILETPQDDLADYAKNMAILIDLISIETKLKLGL